MKSQQSVCVCVFVECSARDTADLIRVFIFNCMYFLFIAIHRWKLRIKTRKINTKRIGWSENALLKTYLNLLVGYCQFSFFSRLIWLESVAEVVLLLWYYHEIMSVCFELTLQRNVLSGLIKNNYHLDDSMFFFSPIANRYSIYIFCSRCTSGIF